MPSMRSRFFYLILRALPSPLDPRRSPAQMRRTLENEARLLPVPRRVSIEKVTVGDRPAEWLRFPGAPEDRAVLYFHGGGYALGSCRSNGAFAARLALASRAPVLVLDYRLAPEHPFPAELDDATAAARWLLDKGIAPGKLALAGDSAGGGLALATSLVLRDDGGPLPAALACFSPWTDLALTGTSFATRAKMDPMISREACLTFVAAYIGDRDPRLPLVSPFYADLRGLPPTLIQVGDLEVLLSDSLGLAENARAAGVEVTLEVWEGMWHVWQAMAGLVPEAQRAIDAAGVFLDRQLSHS
jgi:monoterpene epsilon-lactone hydrolase